MKGTEFSMDKAQIIALYFLLKNESCELNTFSDYIEQFEFVEENIRSILEQKNDHN